ncbi:hypothetical protein CPJCM30710_23920 [Clostridium polyendosporum]|uniref:Uncharacterized protein n=1 Tax=Clostridium polyendosporum TaxID=69208 RepID=A0A919S1R4_9CLOT|nr:hypothetical protein [Clostridium polyendosporum]GIM29726.1 hypothetical protein CPJCM30710_23920 [Clostridium polyendosporum]
MTQKLGKNNRTGEKSYYRNKNNKSVANPVNTDEDQITNNKPVRSLPK